MISPFRSTRQSVFTFLAAASVSHAHPGHEGHELTWDMGHLVAHPLATLGCLAVIVAAALLLVRIIRPPTPGHVHRFRGSQPSREK
jgi:hydrogenase/urease accessory protein HupE